MAVEEGDGIPPRNFPSLINSVINETVPDIPLVLRKEIIKLCAMAGFDREESLFAPNSPESWENAHNGKDEEDITVSAAESAIRKFCELEGIKQEFKGETYRLAGPWRKP